MINTRSKTLRQRDKGKQRAADNPPRGLEASPEQMSGENSVGHSTTQQFLTAEQLGQVLRQVQGVIIRGVCEQIKTPDQQPMAEPGSAFEGNVRRMAEARQALRKAQVSIAPSRSVTTPYMSGTEGAAWYVEQEESSHP